MCQAGRWICGSDIPRGGEEWGGREGNRHVVCKTQVTHGGGEGEQEELPSREGVKAGSARGQQGASESRTEGDEQWRMLLRSGAGR